MKVCLPLLLILLTVTSWTLGQRRFFFPQIGDGVVGDIRFQTTLVLINLGNQVTLRVEFFRSPDGMRQAVTLGNRGTREIFDIQLARGGSVSLQTPGTGNLIVGYARVTDPRDGELLGGTAVFTRSDVPSGVILYEAGVPASDSLESFTAFVDTIEDLDTGLAMVNVAGQLVSGTAGFPELEGAAPIVRMSLRNLDFQEIARTTFPLRNGNHRAAFINQYFDQVPEAAEMQGIVVVESSSAPLVAVTLRQNDIPGVDFPDEVPTLTTFPVVEGSNPLALSGTFSAIDTDRIAVTIRVPDLEWIREVELRFVDADGIVESFYRSVAAGHLLSDVFDLPGRSRSIRQIEVDFAGPGSNRATFVLNR